MKILARLVWINMFVSSTVGILYFNVGFEVSAMMAWYHWRKDFLDRRFSTNERVHDKVKLSVGWISPVV